MTRSGARRRAATGARRRDATDAACVVVAAALLVVSGRPEAAWWWSLLAGAVAWRPLVRASGWTRGVVVAACLLAPVSATAFEGLRTFAPATWPVVIVVVSLAYGVAGATAARLARAWPYAARPLAWGLGWASLDAALLALPWGQPAPITIGYALVGGPLVAWAAVGGPVALGAAWVVMGAWGSALLGGFREAEGVVPGAGAAAGRQAARRGGVVGVPWHRAGALAWGGGATVVVLGAFALQAFASAAQTGPAVRVAVSHGIASTEELRASRDDPAVATALRAALYARSRERPADLHVWPEAALGYVRGEGAQAVALVAAALEAPVLAGAYRPDPEGGWRNAVLLADAGRATWVVDKQRLVPGYEDWLRPGVGERWPVRAAGLRWGVLVCWESLYFDLALERVRGGVDALAVLAHDGWAGRSVTPWWHARAGRALAFATGRPVVVASHDGPSMVWRHDGRMLAVSGPGDHGLLAELAAPLAWTPPFVVLGTRGVGWAVAAGWAVALAANHRVAGRARGARQGCGAAGPHAA